MEPLVLAAKVVGKVLINIGFGKFFESALFGSWLKIKYEHPSRAVVVSENIYTFWLSDISNEILNYDLLEQEVQIKNEENIKTTNWEKTNKYNFKRFH